MSDCPTIPVRTRALDVRFPGGVVLTATTDAPSPNPLELARSMLAQAGPALAPTQAIFNVVGALLAVKDFATAVPELVVNPGAVVDAVQTLIEKIEALAGLVPPLSVPALIVDMIDVILALLDGVSEALVALAAQETRIAAAAELAEQEGLDVLRAGVACAEEQFAAELANLSAGLGPANEMIGLLNVFVGLVPGCPELPALDDLGDDVETAAATVDAAATALRTVRSLIPL